MRWVYADTFASFVVMQVMSFGYLTNEMFEHDTVRETHPSVLASVAYQAKIAETNAFTFTYGGLICGTDYSLGLTVEDAAGNTSALSQAIWFPVRTLACDEPPPPPPPPPGTELNGWQVTPQNVGLAPFGLSCASLPVYTTNPVPAGSHILRRRIAIGGILNLDAGGITIEQSCIQPTGGNVTERMVQSYSAATPNKIIDSEIDGSLLTQQSAAFTCAVRGIYGELSRNYMHGTGSGICHVSYNSSLSYDAIYTNNWVGGLRGYGDPGGTGSHNEAATTRCARIDINPNRRMVWRGNWIQTDTPGNSSGGLFIQTTWGCPIGNLYVENNLLDGGPNWDMYADGTGYSGKFEATNNRFAPGGYGACTVSGFNWTLWTDNYVYSSGSPDGRGAQVSGC